MCETASESRKYVQVALNFKSFAKVHNLSTDKLSVNKMTLLNTLWGTAPLTLRIHRHEYYILSHVTGSLPDWWHGLCRRSHIITGKHQSQRVGHDATKGVSHTMPADRHLLWSERYRIAYSGLYNPTNLCHSHHNSGSHPLSTSAFLPLRSLRFIAAFFCDTLP